MFMQVQGKLINSLKCMRVYKCTSCKYIRHTGYIDQHVKTIHFCLISSQWVYIIKIVLNYINNLLLLKHLIFSFKMTLYSHLFDQINLNIFTETLCQLPYIVKDMTEKSMFVFL